MRLLSFYKGTRNWLLPAALVCCFGVALVARVTAEPSPCGDAAASKNMTAEQKLDWLICMTVNQHAAIADNHAEAMRRFDEISESLFLTKDASAWYPGGGLTT